MPDADLAAVEDRNLECDVETPFPEWSAFRLASLLVDPRKIEKRDESCCLRELERLRKKAQLNAGHLEIDTMCDGIHLDARQRQWLARQGRQFLWQPEAEVTVPQSKQADQALAGACGILAKRRKVGRDLRIEDLLTGLVELVQRSGLSELQGKLRRGFRCGLCIGKQDDEFVGPDRTIIGAPDLGREPKRLVCRAQLSLLEALAGNLRSERQGGQRQNVSDHLTLDLVPAIACDARNRESRIGRQAFLDKLGFGQGQFVVRRLQAAIVQERDLDGGVHRQRLDEEGLGRRLSPVPRHRPCEWTPRLY